MMERMFRRSIPSIHKHRLLAYISNRFNHMQDQQIPEHWSESDTLMLHAMVGDSGGEAKT